MEISRLCSAMFVIVILSKVNSESLNAKWKLNGKRRADLWSNNNQADDAGQLKSVTVRHTNAKEPTAFVNGRGDDDESKNQHHDEPHSRKKRLIWITDDGRLALPPGTVLSITPTLSLPLVRYPPDGFLSNLTMSFPLTSKLKFQLLIPMFSNYVQERRQ